MSNQRTKRNLAVLLIAAAVLASGLALTVWAEKPEKPGGGKPGGGGKGEPRYTIVDLGTLGGGTYGHSINKWSQVAGSSRNADNRTRAFLVTPEYDGDGNLVWFRDDNPEDGINDLMMDIGTLDGDRVSSAFGVNDAGQVVGYSFREVGEIVRQHAFLWTPDVPNGTTGSMIDLRTVGLDYSFAFGISNSGYVVGEISGLGLSFPFPIHAFIVVPEDTTGPGGTPDGVPDTWFRDQNNDEDNDLMIDVGTLPGHSESTARAVNDSGQVVGQSRGRMSDLTGRGFLITPVDVDDDGDLDWFSDDGEGGNALMIELSPLPGHEGSRAVAINSSGQVVGSSWSMGKHQSSDYHAVLWEVDAQGNVTVTDLGKPSGKGLTSARGINDAGQVVGTGGAAFLWENGTMTKLMDLVANSEGITGLTPFGINKHGEIAGTVTGDGYRHAFIALPIPAAP